MQKHQGTNFRVPDARSVQETPQRENLGWGDWVGVGTFE